MDAKNRKFFPEIDSTLCKSCGYCEMVCPQQMFCRSGKVNSQGYDYMKVNEDGTCIGCLKCINICPDFVITIYENGSMQHG